MQASVRQCRNGLKRGELPLYCFITLKCRVSEMPMLYDILFGCCLVCNFLSSGNPSQMSIEKERYLLQRKPGDYNMLICMQLYCLHCIRYLSCTVGGHELIMSLGFWCHSLLLFIGQMQLKVFGKSMYLFIYKWTICKITQIAIFKVCQFKVILSSNVYFIEEL